MDLFDVPKQRRDIILARMGVTEDEYRASREEAKRAQAIQAAETPRPAEEVPEQLKDKLQISDYEPEL